VDIDVTYLIQLGLFLFCVVTINSLLLKPFLRVIQAREKAIEGAQEETEELQNLGDADMEAYQTRMREVRREAQGEREALKNEGRDEERKHLTEVRAGIAAKLNEARQSIGVSEDNARKLLAQDKDSMAQQLVGKLLGREVA